MVQPYEVHTGDRGNGSLLINTPVNFVAIGLQALSQRYTLRTGCDGDRFGDIEAGGMLTLMETTQED